MKLNRFLRVVRHALVASLSVGWLSLSVAQPIAAPPDAVTPASDQAPFKIAPGGVLANPGVVSKLAGVEMDPPAVTRGDNSGLEKMFEARCRSVVFIVAVQGDGENKVTKTGTGAIVTQDGHVLTAAHVIEGADQIAVGIFPDCNPGTNPDQYTASLFRVDEVADLALIKLDSRPKNLNVMPLGSLAPVRTGSQVVMIGHPKGLLMSMSTGVVSAIRPNFAFKTNEAAAQRATVIQTDGALNPGNSGGPMMTPKGELIGVNSFIFGNASAGLNFAVSVNDVRAMLSRKSDRFVARADESPKASASSGGSSEKSDTCEEKLKVLKTWKDDGADKSLLDVNCAGKGNAMLVVPGKGGDNPYLLLDRNGDGKGDVVYNLNAKGEPESSTWDDDYDGNIDYRADHVNGNWEPKSKRRVSSR